MKKPSKRTRRGMKFAALAEGYKMMDSPLAQSYGATAEHFDKTDPPIEESEGWAVLEYLDGAQPKAPAGRPGLKAKA